MLPGYLDLQLQLGVLGQELFQRFPAHAYRAAQPVNILLFSHKVLPDHLGLLQHLDESRELSH